MTPESIPADPAAHRRLPSTLIAGLTIVAVLILIAIVAPMLLGDAADSLTDQTRQPPSAEHWLGTDEFGRDVLARCLVATRLTLLLTLLASVISVGGGILFGVGSWFLPPALRRFVIGWNGIIVAFPSMIIALIAAVILGAGALQAAVAVGIAGIPSFTRLTSNISAPIVDRDYVRVARELGVSFPKIMSRHVLPNIAEPLLIISTGHVIVVLVELSGLSFVGLGVQSPEYDFGKLLNDGLTAIFSRPSEVVGPALMLVLTGLGVTLIGDGLAARANPRLRRRSRNHVRTQRAMRLASATRSASHSCGSEADVAGYVVVDDLTIRDQEGAVLVQGVSFTIAPGEILGIVGESGSGKSLTAMSLAGLVPEGLQMTAATLRVGDQDMRVRGDDSTRAREIAMIYQDPMASFNPVYTVGSQLTEVARTHLGMSRATARRAMVERMADLGISHPERRFRQHAHELSGGMLQRAVIASALLTDARLFIADEPTTALDVRVQLSVVRAFSRVSRHLGAAVLFISHDIALVRELCDRVIVMKDGAVVEELTPQEIATARVQSDYSRRLIAASDYVERIERVE
jgi:ABC-type dipeptide/oligopeptide/nickel transport system ATPase component/ABC-type dipeptide/oligopeptide/nickel transport system permease subunit